MLAARKQVAAARQAGLRDPGDNRNAGRIGEFKPDRFTGLLLDSDLNGSTRVDDPMAEAVRDIRSALSCVSCSYIVAI